MASDAAHKPAILFGLGATKAGTSWLHQHLARHPDVHMPAVKELHYFDAKFFRRVPAEVRRLLAEREALTGRIAEAEPAVADRLRARQAEIGRLIDLMLTRTNDPAFADFLTASAPNARLVGDITPAYALLPARLLARMQGLTTQVRFVYLMRDPVDRLWSHVRMVAARAAETADGIGARAARIFDRWATGQEPGISARGDYAGALERMGRAIRPENLLVLFYERLFTPETMARLAAFLGIADRPADFAQRIHAGVPVPLDPAQRARARTLLAPQYDYVGRVCGELPARWRENG